MKELLQIIGLHPIVGFGMFAIDLMLFGSEMLIPPSVILTVPTALLLGMGSILIQRYSFNDGWGAATGKGMIVGVLTAIPSPLPSVITLLGGTAGLVKMGTEKKEDKKTTE